MPRSALSWLALAASAWAGTEALPGHWTLADDLAPAEAWTSFQSRHPGPWSVYTDLATGAPSLIAGAPIPAGMVVRADEAGIARARAFLEELRDVLRVDEPSAFVLERAVTVINPHGQELVFVNFKQTWRGLDVWHQSDGGERERLALVKLRFKGSDLVLLGSDAVPALAVPDEVRLQESEATHRAVGLVGTTALAAVETRSYVSVRGSRAFLARDVEVRTDEPAHRWRFLFDAHSGTLVERRDEPRTRPTRSRRWCTSTSWTTPTRTWPTGRRCARTAPGPPVPDRGAGRPRRERTDDLAGGGRERPGVTLYFQGLSQDPAGQLYLSDRHTFVHTP